LPSFNATRKGQLALALAFFSLCAYALVFPAYSQDTWMYLKQGQTLVAWRGFPPGDLFSYDMPARPWPRFAWLFSVSSWLVFKSWGLNALIFCKVAIAAASFGTLSLVSQKRGASWLVSASGLGLLLLATQLDWTERPQVLAFFFFSLTLLVLERPEGRAPWLLALGILWSNFHDSATFFALFVAVTSLGAWLSGSQSLGQAGSALAAAFLGTLLNPDYGHAWIQTLEWMAGGGQDAMRLIPEWAAPVLPQNPAYACLLVFGLLALVPMLRRKRYPEALGMAFLAALSLKTARMVPFYCLAAAAWVPSMLGLSRPKPLSGLILGLAAFVLVSKAALDPITGHLGPYPGKFPIGAAEYLSQHPPKGHLGNTRWDGDYLMFRLGPDIKVFLDSRLGQVYPFERLYAENELFLAKPHWRDVALHFGMTDILVPLKPYPFPLAAVLERDSQWKLVYQDETGELFTLKVSPG
jgi:hypothetical protein